MPIQETPAEKPPELSDRQKRRVAERLVAAEQAEKARKFDAAVNELNSAYLVSHDPELLGRMARDADRAGRRDAAELYRRYLDEGNVPAETRAEIEKRLQALEPTRP